MGYRHVDCTDYERYEDIPAWARDSWTREQHEYYLYTKKMKAKYKKLFQKSSKLADKTGKDFDIKIAKIDEAIYDLAIQEDVVERGVSFYDNERIINFLCEYKELLQEKNKE